MRPSVLFLTASLRPGVAALVIGALAGCGDSPSSGATDAETDAVDVIGDLPEDVDDGGTDIDAADAVPDTEDAADTVEIDVDEGGGIGDPCEVDADCASGECAVLAGGVPGICTSFCTTGADCPEGFDCILLTNSGADASYLCIPRDYCADGDDDRFGVGPGCLGIDCDDTNDAVNFSADELCDGIDNDCDELIDENAIDVGGDCVSGFLGPCGPGRLVCQAANIVCEPRVVPSEELCDGVDNNCDGEIDNDPVDVTLWYRDADEDRYGNPDDSIAACEAPEGYIAAGEDCDDTRRDVNPTVPEVCDGIDNDCNTVIDTDAGEVPVWYVDADNDGFGTGEPMAACTQPDGYAAESGDCDDANELVYPGAEELCDGLDNDCDDDVDEDGRTDWYADFDIDGFGDPAAVVSACAQPEGYVANPLDCDDGTDAVSPDATEVCNDIDDNCVDGIDEDAAADATTWYRDADADTWGSALDVRVACVAPESYVARVGDCDDATDAVNPDATELCNSVDDNCRDGVDENTAADAPTWFRDADNDTYGNAADTTRACVLPVGYVADATDCNDANGNVNPAATEVCNSIDDNCRDGIDENSAADAPTWYLDADGDTWGRGDVTARACSQPGGYAARAGDCNDGNGAVNPGIAEVCNGVDDNCAGGIDEGVLVAFYRDADADGWGNAGDAVLACSNPGGRVTLAGDCDDGNFRRNPGLPERCDGIDNNCDGTFTSINRRGRIVEYDGSCQNFGGGNANDLCFGESWNGQGYMHCHYHQSWDNARSVCQARGMDLADINSAEENAAVIGAFNGQDGESWDDLWIGGRETGTVRHFQWIRTGSVFWQNGSVGLYANWRSGEPSNDSGGANNDCSSVYQSDFRWNDRSCGGSIEFICEW